MTDACNGRVECRPSICPDCNGRTFDWTCQPAGATETTRPVPPGSTKHRIHIKCAGCGKGALYYRIIPDHVAEMLVTHGKWVSFIGGAVEDACLCLVEQQK